MIRSLPSLIICSLPSLIIHGLRLSSHPQLRVPLLSHPQVWQATALPDPSQPATLDFVLDAAADGDGGFGYSARGLPQPPAAIRCTFEGDYFLIAA